MSALDREIINFIKKASLRLKTNVFFKNFIVGLIVSLCLSLFIIITSVFIIFQGWIELCVMIIILSIITSIIVSIIKLPKFKEVALIVDNKGLKERVTTYLELSHKEDPLSNAQKADTLKHIKNYNLKVNLPIKFHRRGLYIIAILTAFCMVGAVIPSKSRNEEKQLRKFQKYKNEIIKKIEKEKKNIVENNKFSDEEKKVLDDNLKKTIEELKLSKNKKENEKAIEKLEKKLDNIKIEKNKKELDNLKNSLIKDFKDKKAKENNEDKNKIITELNKVKEGKDLSKAIEEGNKENLLEALKKLNKNLEKMTESEKSKLASALKNSNLNDTDLQKALANGANGAINGEINENELAEALQSLSNSENKNGENSNNSSKNNGEISNNGSSSGNGNGGNSNSGGNGSGPGTGQGWNTGSKNGNEKDFEEGKKEEVFIPGRGEGKDNNLTGNKNGDGNSQIIETESGLNKKGEKVNYESVLGDYSNKAMESLNNTNLPEAMKNAVKEYFNELE